MKEEPETLMPRRSKDDGNFYTSEETFCVQQNCFYQSANHVFNIQARKINQLIFVIKYKKTVTITSTHKLPSVKLLIDSQNTILLPNISSKCFNQSIKSQF